jgi:hypothetical protein
VDRRGLAGLASLALLLGALACGAGDLGAARTVRGSGTVVQEERRVGDFSGVELATLGNLSIELGDNEALRIEAEDNLLEYLVTEVRGDRLVIEQQDEVRLVPKEPVNFSLTARQVDAISISGSGDAQAPDLETEHFSISINGSGDLAMGDLTAETVEIHINGSGNVQTGNLRADTLNVDIAGSGNLRIAGGEVQEQQITVAGSGSYRARQLASAQAEVNIPGSGSVVIRVDERLRADVSGSGGLRYAGEPEVDERVTGSGEVQPVAE